DRSGTDPAQQTAKSDIKAQAMSPHAIAKGGLSMEVEASQFRLKNTKERYIELVAVPDDEGGYSAYVPILPGVHSQGESLLEALANIEEALDTVLDEYQKGGQPVPWLMASPEETNPKHKCKWIRRDA